jgi:acyl transferase domain-containing protein
MKNEVLPPQCHFNEPTDMVNLIRSPFYVNVQKKSWKRTKERVRYAAAYSYGYGGNNIVTIIKEAPEIDRETPLERKELFILTAATKESFEKYIDEYIEYLKEDENCSLTDICYVASTGRMLKQEYRLAVVTENKQMLREQLIHYRNTHQETEGLFFSHRETAPKDRRTIRQSISGKSLIDIAVGFCAGESFSFKELFNGIKVTRCKLPMYPFDKVSCWTQKEKFSLSAYMENSKKGREKEHGNY